MRLEAVTLNDVYRLFSTSLNQPANESPVQPTVLNQLYHLNLSAFRGPIEVTLATIWIVEVANSEVESANVYSFRDLKYAFTGSTHWYRIENRQYADLVEIAMDCSTRGHATFKRLF